MLTDGWTDGKADTYIAPCYKQVRQKPTIKYEYAENLSKSN